MSMRNLKVYIPGSILIVFSLLVVMVPEILILIVASLIFMAGILLLYGGHTIRKSSLETEFDARWSSDKNGCRRQFSEAPQFVRWFRKI